MDLLKTVSKFFDSASRCLFWGVFCGFLRKQQQQLKDSNQNQHITNFFLLISSLKFHFFCEPSNHSYADFLLVTQNSHVFIGENDTSGNTGAILMH